MTTVPLVDGNAKLVESVPVSVSELLAVRVLPDATLRPVTDVAAIVPVPVALIEAPEPTTIAAAVLVPLVMPLNDPGPPPVPHVAPVPLVSPFRSTCTH